MIKVSKKKKKFYKQEVSKEKKLDASFKKIDKIFEKKQGKRLSVKSEKNKKHHGKGNTISTYDKYAKQCKNFMKTMKITDIKQITPQKINEYIEMEIEKYQNGDPAAAGRINVKLSALKSLQQGIKNTDIIGKGAKEEIDFGDIQEYRNHVTSKNVFRSAKASTYRVATNREVRTVHDRFTKKAEETGDHLDKIARDFTKYAQITGCRSANGLAVRKKDITLHADGTATVIHYKDKGSLTRKVTFYDPKKVAFLKELKEQNNNEEKVFQAYKANGKHMSNEDLQEIIEEKFKGITEDLVFETKKVKIKGNETEFEVNQRLVPHSIRKNFGTNRTIELYDYFMKNPKETNKRIKEVLDEMTSRDPKVGEKYAKAVEKQNARNKKYAEKNGNTKYKVVDFLTPEQSSLFFCSTELGHYRTSILVDSYLDREAWSAAKAKYKK